MTYLFLHHIMHLLMFLSPDSVTFCHIISLFYKFTRFFKFFSVSLWRRANARNVRLYSPYWHYTNLFIFPFPFSSLSLAVNDDYRMVCYRMGLRLSGIAVTAGLPQKEKCAFGSNNTGRNWTEFWFVVFKSWSFLGGRSPNVGGPAARAPSAPLLIRSWGSWANNPVITCDIHTCVYARVYWFLFRTCERKTCIKSTINIRFLNILFPCWTYVLCINCYYYIYIFSTFKGTKHNIGKRHQFNCPEGDVGKVVSRLFQRRYNQIWSLL